MVLPQQVPNYGYYLGDNLNAVLTDVRKDEIRRALNLGERIVATNVREFIVEMFTRQGDPTGVDRVKPVRGTRRKNTRIAIGRQVIWESPMDSVLRDNAIAIFRADYRRNRALVAQGLMPLDALRRWTGSMRRRLGIRAEELLPPEYVGDGELAPRSSVSDSFPQGDETPMTGWTSVAGTWSVVSNEASSGSSPAMARYNTDLDSDDHYCQHKASSYTNSAKWFGCALRFSASADTAYHAFARLRATTSVVYFYERVAGSYNLVDSTGVGTETLPVVVYGHIDAGDDWDIRLDTVSKLTGLDNTTITGNLRVGLSGDGGGTNTLDDMAGADLAAGWTGKINGVTNPAKINGIAVADIAKVIGVA
jgi:hypothetical protein